ncbi:MAG: S8 family serine peptidase, partial [bacterium]|nr:S8 family serine peptidase [bacterium]
DLYENPIFVKDENSCTGDCGHLSMGYNMLNQGSKFVVRLQNDGNGYHHMLTSNSAFSTGVWYHVVLTFGSQGMHLYVNGAEHDFDTSMKGMETNNLPLKLGCSYTGTSFAGDIDEIQVWDRILSVEEIKASFNAKVYPLSASFNNLQDDVYPFYAYAINIDGNTAVTETRSVTVGDVQRCSDSTAYGACSDTQPLYCDSGALINDCYRCDCPISYLCQSDGTCMLSQTEAVKVLPFGYSTTFGFGNPSVSWDDINILVSWRKKLKELLEDDGIEIDYVGSQRSGWDSFDDPENEGYPGHRMDTLERRLSEGVIEEYDPDVVIISPGTNDLWRSVGGVRTAYDISHVETVILPQFENLLETLHQKKPSMQIVYQMSNTPVIARPEPLNTFKAGAQELVDERIALGWNIAVADCTGVPDDGWHFTPSGCEECAERIYPALKDTVAVAECFDSDGGMNYHTRGVVTVSGGTERDSCVDSNTLSEWHCVDSENYASVTYTCPAGCANGACVPDAALSLATLKNNYDVGEHIQLTDPPDASPQAEVFTGYSDIQNSDNPMMDVEMFNPEDDIYADDEREEPVKSKGFIIKLEEEPLAEKAKTLNEKAAKNEEKIESMSDINPIKYGYMLFSLRADDVPEELEEHEEDLEADKEKVKRKIKQKLGKSGISSVTGNVVGTASDTLGVIEEYETVFNGLVLDISVEEAEKIEELDGVERVYPNNEVNAFMMDSVPLINADDVWTLDEDKNDCSVSGQTCLTGEGITIGIIDTGVDYTHPDLGGTYIPEREFEQISEETLVLPFGYDLDEQIDINDNKLVFFSQNMIFVHSFDTGETMEINAFSDDLEILRIAFDDNLIAYFASEGQDYPLVYLYNMETGVHEQISSGNYGVGSISVSNGKIVYGKKSGIFVYDPITEQETAILTGSSNMIHQPSVSGDLVAYSVSGDDCFDHLVIHNIESGETRELNPPDVGPVLDMKGNKILYVDCSKSEMDRQWRSYHLYDIETQEAIPISFYSAEEDSGSDINIESYAVTSNINKGTIGGDVVFFSKDVNSANKIIAYDLNLDQYVLINLRMSAGHVRAQGNKVCFVSSDSQVYCHDYNPSNDYTAPEQGFNDKVIGGYDFFNQDDDPMDDNGHGTHCAGTAAGNGVLNGIAPDAKIYAYKVLSDGGSGYWDDIIAAIERSVDPNQDGDFSDHLDIISLSLGGSGDPDDPMSIAIDNAFDAGVVAVVAAGNSGSSPETIGSPGTARKAITVGATYKTDYDGDYWRDSDPRQDQITSFSSRGPVVWDGGYMMKPDIVAPGAIICAARYGAIFPEGEHPYYKPCIDELHVQIAGTSMATPVVAGAAALLRQAHPDWSPAEIKTALKNTAVDIGYDVNTQGQGRVNILEAVQLTTPPPIAMIETSGKFLGSYIDIIGTATADDFADYTLYYGEGADSSAVSWIEICSSTDQVTNDVLCEWDIRTFNDGFYSLKLVVHSTTGTSNAYGSIDIQNSEISSPTDLRSGLYWDVGEAHPTWKEIVIKGSSGGYGFDHYEIEWNKKDTTSWSVQGVSLTGDGDDPVTDDVIGTIDFSFLSDSDRYFIKLTTYYTDGRTSSEDIEIYVDSKIQEGWPRFLYDSGLSFIDQPVIADINGDGKDDVITAYGQRISVFMHDGEQASGWPKTIDTTWEDGDYSGDCVMQYSLVVDDMDNDGFNEIAVGDNCGYLHVLEHNGEYVTGWPRKISGRATKGLAIGDIDGDSEPEILMGSYDSYLFILNLDGTEVIQPLARTEFSTGSYAIGDIDTDGQQELVLRNKNFVSVYEYSNGALDLKWDKSIMDYQAFVFVRPNIILADLDEENEGLEIATVDETKLYVWDKDGNDINGWPKEIEACSPYRPEQNLFGLAASDINHDDFIDLIVFGTGSCIYAFTPDGETLPGSWPTSSDRAGFSYGAKPIIGNLINDADLEISFSIGGIGAVPGRLVPFNIIDSSGEQHQIAELEDGLFMDGIPIADLDGDGDNELIVLTRKGNLIVFDMPGAASDDGWPQYYHDSQHTSSYEEFVPKPQSKIENFMDIELSGKLNIRIQKQVGDMFVDYAEVVSGQAVTVPANGLVKLDHIFNPLNVVINEAGTYRVYAEMTDNQGQVIQTVSGALQNSWEFTVS